MERAARNSGPLEFTALDLDQDPDGDWAAGDPVAIPIPDNRGLRPL